MPNMRWMQGRAKVIGGWESLIGELLTEVCRNALPWNDNASLLNIAFGAHYKLTLWQGAAPEWVDC